MRVKEKCGVEKRLFFWQKVKPFSFLDEKRRAKVRGGKIDALECDQIFPSCVARECNRERERKKNLFDRRLLFLLLFLTAPVSSTTQACHIYHASEQKAQKATYNTNMTKGEKEIYSDGHWNETAWGKNVWASCSLVEVWVKCTQKEAGLPVASSHLEHIKYLISYQVQFSCNMIQLLT